MQWQDVKVRRALTILSWTLFGTGLGLALFHLFLDSGPAELATLGSAIGLAVAFVISAVLLRVTPTVWCGAAIVAALVVAQHLISVRRPNDLDWSITGQVLSLFLQIFLIVSLGLVVRRRLGSDTRGVFGDSLIVGLGVWLVVWVTLLQPSIDQSTETSLVNGLRGTSLALSIIVLFLLAILLFSDSMNTASVIFIFLAIAFQFSADVLRSYNARGGSIIGINILHSLFIAFICTVSAAILHPSIRSLLKPDQQRQLPALMTRLITTTVSLVVPVLVLAITDSKDATDRLIRTISVVVLAIAVTTRVIQSVRANAVAQSTLLHNASMDSLTGLPNRTLMLEHISKALNLSSSNNAQPTVLFIDIDRFKNINDSLGHSAGDDVLSAVAKRLTNAVPANALVGRISGDEFVVLDASTNTTTQSVLLAEKVLDAFREPLAVRPGDMFVSASVGVATAPNDIPLSAEDLLRNADTAMYRAKDAGRNCIALFDESMLERITQRLTVETALYRALERKELHLVHQPIVDVELGLVIGFEALMRWDRLDGGTVPPAEFIPIAEETGTIVPIGSWAILDALTHLRHWIDSGACGLHATMSVNVSPRQLHDPNFVSIVSEALARSGIAPHQLWLEITESVMVTEPEQALVALKRLVALGVRIAIDDFGTGYSSLSLLQRFPIQRIKIDRAFVNEIVSNRDTQSLVRTIIAMGQALNLELVAEGVENALQLRALVEMNCTKAQGFLISHPVPVGAIPSTVVALQDLPTWNRLIQG